MGFKQIFEGWKRVFIEDPETEQEAERRAKICSSCPSLEYSKAVDILTNENKIESIQGYVCGECKCPLIAKTRSKTTICEKNKW